MFSMQVKGKKGKKRRGGARGATTTNVFGGAGSGIFADPSKKPCRDWAWGRPARIPRSPVSD